MNHTKSNLILLYGPPCAGKSALANNLAKDFNYKLLSTDLLRVSYFDELKEMYQPNNVSIIYNMLFQRIDSNIKLNNSLIVEGMFLTEINKIRVLEYSRHCNISFIYVTANYQILLQRLNIRNKKGSSNILQHIVPLSATDLLEFYNKSNLPLHKDLIVDTSFDDVAASYSKLKAIIEKKFSIDFLKKNILNATDK